MSLVRRLVLGTVGFVLVALLVLHRIEGGTRGALIGVGVLLLLLAACLAYLAGSSVVHRLAALTTEVRQAAVGAAARFHPVGVPELDALSEALRQMHQEVASRIETLHGERRDAAAIIEAMADGVIAADLRGRITIANPAARRLLGYPDQAALPDLPTLFRDKAARAAIDDVLAGAIVRDRELAIDDRTLLIDARPLGNHGVMVVVHDRTAVRRLEVVRRDFVANASHELKTPLTSIAGYAETLAADGGTMDEATRRRFLETILANARRMQQLVDDLLDLSRIESGRWQPAPEPVELARAADESWGLLAAKADARQLRLVRAIAADATILTADPETVRQLLGNLFDNAIRYLPDGGTITVRSERRDGGILLSIEDNGSGIAAEHLPRIFERFYRVDPSRSREEGGTGLGLAIVKHMVESQGGRVWAESVLREGTAIRCWFATQ